MTILRTQIMKSLIKEANSQIEDFSYSAVMRKIRKKYPERVKDFMAAFKQAFDYAKKQKIEIAEQAALIQAIKSIGL